MQKLYVEYCFRDSLLVPLINCGTSFYAGFVIFSVLGFMATNKDTEVANVVDDGNDCSIHMVELVALEHTCTTATPHIASLSTIPSVPIWP